MEFEQFTTIKGSDLRGTCIENECTGTGEEEICIFGCVEDGHFLEVIAVGNFKRDPEDPYTASAMFVIMELK